MVLWYGKLKDYLILTDKIIIVECVSLNRNNTEQERQSYKNTVT